MPPANSQRDSSNRDSPSGDGSDPYALSEFAIAEPPVGLWNALRQIGPGIVLAGSIVGSGELILTTSLGAKHGFKFLWLILFSCVIKVFVQIELGRHALSSGKPTLPALNDMPGPRWRVNWQVWCWLAMLLLTVFQLGGMVGGVSQAVNLAFPNATPKLAETAGHVSPAFAGWLSSRPTYPWAVVTALAAVLLLVSGGYRRLERITTILVVGVTAITVICVALVPTLGFPIRLSDLREGFSLSMFADMTPAELTAAIALAFSTFGVTGVGANELYAYPYWCLEKGYGRSTGPRSDSPEWAARARGWIRVMVLDAWVSMIVFTIATVAFYCLGATVLHRQGLVPEGNQVIETLSEMYVPVFGDWTKIVFLIGAWAVLFKTVYVASAGHSRLTADFLGLAGFVRYDAAPGLRQKWITRCCVFYPLLALSLYLIFGNPKQMVVIGGLAQAAILPLISGAAVFLRYRRTDPRLAPSRGWDACLWTAFGSITIVALYSLYATSVNDLVPLLSDWMRSIRSSVR